MSATNLSDIQLPEHGATRPHFVLGLLLLVTMCIAPDLSHAQNITWGNNATDYNSSASWSAGGPPTTTNNAVFSGTASSQPNLTANATNQALFFSSNASGFILSADPGRSLTLSANTSINASNTSGTNTIDAPLILSRSAGGAATFSQAAGGTLVVNGAISSTNSITGLSLSGNASFTLGGSNTYAGNTTIVTSGATLNINSATAISSGALILSANQNINNTSGAAITLANNNNINLSGGSLTFLGNSSSSSLNFGSNTVTASGASRTITTTAGGTLTIGRLAADTAARNFTHSGSGTLVIQNAADASYGGNTTLNNATITVIGNSSAFGTGGLVLNTGTSGSLRASTDVNLANAWQIGTSSTTFAGTSNITLSGTYAGASGTRTLVSDLSGGAGLIIGSNLGISDSASNRTLQIGGNGNTTVNGIISNGGTATASSLQKLGSGTLTLNGANTYNGTTTISEGTLALGAGSSLGNLGASDLTLGGSGASAGSTAALTIDPTATVSLDATLTYAANGNATNLGATISGGTILLNSSARAFSVADSASAVDLTIHSTLGNGTFFKQGAGAMLLAGNNTYTGSTRIVGGTLIAGGNVSVSVSGVFGNNTNSIDLGHSTTAVGENVSLLTGGAFTIARGVTVNVGSSGQTAFTSTLGGNTDNTSTFSGAISMRKDLTIAQVATTGGNALQITGGISGEVTSANKTVTFAGPGAINVATAAISNGTGGGTMSVNVTGGTTTFAGTNTYTGATVISSGTLRAAAANALGNTTSIAVGNSGNLEITASNAVNNSATITLGGGAIERASGVTETFGALVLTANSTLNFGTGAIGSLTFNGTGSAYSSAFRLNVTNFLEGNQLIFTNYGDMTSTVNDTALFSFSNGFTTAWNGSDTFTITAIPEPGATAALAGLGILLVGSRLFGRNQRRREGSERPSVGPRRK